MNIGDMISNAQIAFGIATIAFILALYVLGVFRKDNRKKSRGR